MVKNLTVGNPALLILSFATPLFIGNAFQQFYNMADTFIVGRTIGLNALAAVGSTGSINFLIIGFVFGFAAGTSIITSQRFGAGDKAGVRKSFAISIIVSVGMAIVLTAVSVPCTRLLLELLQTPPEIADQAYSYIVIIFCGIPATVLFSLLSNTMRAVGDSHTPLIFLMIACVINILLDLFFIIVLHAGVKGAAYATVIAQVVSGLLCIPFIAKKIPVLKLTGEDWHITFGEIAKQLKLALPSGFQMSIIAIGAVTVTYVINKLGTSAVAAFTAASKIDQTASMVLASFGAAMITYSAQNYGARKPDRIRKGIIQCSIISCSYSVLIALLLLIFGRFFAGIFLGRESENALSMAHTFLIINSAFYPFLAMLFIIRQSLQGLGDSVTPTIAGIMELVMRIFAALVLGKAAGFTGICFASPLAWFGAVVPLVIALVITMKKLYRNNQTGRFITGGIQ